MDIFTILVFFLLVNATSSEVLPTSPNIKLPDSTSKLEPKQTLVITVNDQGIRLQGKPISSIEAVLKNKETTIPPLLAALAAEAERLSEEDRKKGVTIMGDRSVSYELIKKIMFTAATAKFGNISFAVNQQAAGKPE